MFQAPNHTNAKQQINSAEKNYVIQKNDHLDLAVFTNQGERLIDPEAYLRQERPEGNTQTNKVPFLVDGSGIVKFPMIGELKLEGLSIREAEEILQKEYEKFYQQPFVVLQYLNKRVVVLGAPGGQIIPLAYENMRLTEVLAAAKGIDKDAKATNVRVLRGDTLFVADLSTFEGYRKNDILMEPGDIVYVEPIRRPLSEGLRDYGPLISIITSLTTLIVVIIGL